MYEKRAYMILGVPRQKRRVGLSAASPRSVLTSFLLQHGCSLWAFRFYPSRKHLS